MGRGPLSRPVVMPIYEFKCLDCERVFEKLLKVTDPQPSECDVCAGRVEKLISRTGFQFKGEGWYVTDYGKGSKTTEKPAKSESSDSTSSTDKASKQSESTGGTSKQE